MTKVYVANVCENADIKGLYPDERLKEIQSVTNPQVKLQKISSWKLLEKAVHDCFGYKLSELNFSRNANGKWTCDKLFFSLSHTADHVAVAVSDKSVGVDIESFTAFEKRRVEKLADKILCPEERAENSAKLLQLWTEKESIFKCVGGGVFLPDKIHTEQYPVQTVQYGEYCISVCGEGVKEQEMQIKEMKI